MNLSAKLLMPFPLIAALLLSGCASGYLVESNVQSFSSLAAPLPAPATYRFERLPSQQVPAQAQLEAAAANALQNAGLRLDASDPRYTVQLGARFARVLSPWASWDDWGWGPRFHRHPPFGRPWRDLDSTWYQREASVIVRELQGGEVVFESRAVNEGPWLDSPQVFGALFEAALAGFPNPPSGPRVVNVQVAH